MPDSKEIGLKIVINDFIAGLPETLSGSRVSIINIPRSEHLMDFLDPEILDKSVFIQIGEGVDATAKLTKAIKENDFVFIEFTGKLPADIFGHLKSISVNGLFEAYDLKNNVRSVEVLKEGTRLILVSERKFVETQYGNLNNLTTQILDLEEFI